MKHLRRFNENIEDHFEMMFGDESTIFKGFDTQYEEDKNYLDENEGKVKLNSIGFAEEWSDAVDYEKSYAFIENGKLHVVVYGLSSDRDSVESYFRKTLDSYIDREYGEFFETEPGCPICMIVMKNGTKKIV
jgi:hypothetical protein